MPRRTCVRHSAGTRRPSTSSVGTSATVDSACALLSNPNRTNPVVSILASDGWPRSRFHRRAGVAGHGGSESRLAHETMSGLSFHHGVAQALWHGKLFHIDLNAQRIGKFDQDFRFGSEGIRRPLYVVKLSGSAWEGMRHFDADPYRIEDTEGVWDFAGGCMRTYLHPCREGRRFREDAEIQAALAGGHGRADLGRIDRPRWRDRADPQSCEVRRRSAGREGYGHERLDQLVTEFLPGVLVSALVVGVDSSTSACKVQVRDAETGARRDSGAVRIQPDDPALQRASIPVTGRARPRRLRRGGSARGACPPSPSPSRPATWPRGPGRERARCCGRPSSGMTPSPLPMPQALLDRPTSGVLGRERAAASLS